MEKHYIKAEEIKPLVGVSVDEKEVAINISYLEDTATIFVSDNIWLTKCKKNALKDPEGWKCYYQELNKNGNITGYFFETNKKNINLRVTTYKTMSEEHKEKIKEALKRAKEKKQ